VEKARLTNELAYFIAGGGYLAYCRLGVFTTIEVFKGFIEQSLDHIGMQIGSAEDHHLLITRRIKLLYQLFTDDPVEFITDDTPIEGLHLEVHLVFQLSGIDLAGASIDDADLFAFFEFNPLLGKNMYRNICMLFHRLMLVIPRCCVFASYTYV
jgi:hypothetical protein